MQRTWTQPTEVEAVDELEVLNHEIVNTVRDNESENEDVRLLLDDIETLESVATVCGECDGYNEVIASTMLRTVNLIKERWYLTGGKYRIATEAYGDDYSMVKQEAQVALEGLLDRFGEWLGNKWDKFLDLAIKYIKLNRQIRKFLDKNKNTLNEITNDYRREVDVNYGWYGGLCIDGKFSIDTATRQANSGRAITDLAKVYTAKIAWADPYTRVSELKENVDIGHVSKIGKSIPASMAIRQALPAIRKWNSKIEVTALPGSVYLCSGVTLTGIHSIDFAVAPWEDFNEMSVMIDRRTLESMFKALYKYEKLIEELGVVFNKAQPEVLKAKADYKANKDKWHEVFKKDTRQLKQNISNAIAVEQAISASVTMCASGLLGLCKAAVPKN